MKKVTVLFMYIFGCALKYVPMHCTLLNNQTYTYTYTYSHVTENSGGQHKNFDSGKLKNVDTDFLSLTDDNGRHLFLSEIF